MVNGPDDAYVEREGRIERAPDGLFEEGEPVLPPMGWCGGAPGCALTRTAGGQSGPHALHPPGNPETRGASHSTTADPTIASVFTPGATHPSP